jgi:hypothetical protein
MYSNDPDQVEFIMLDDSCLHEIAIASQNSTKTEIINWLLCILQRKKKQQRIVVVPEIVLYVVHRQLLKDRQVRAVDRLEALLEKFECIPIDSEITKRAARISANFPREDDTILTLSTLDSLDKDAILIAQYDKFITDRQGDVNLVLATLENNRNRFENINIQNWQDIPMYDVFLCYNSQDKAEVLRIAEDLDNRGIRVWLDEWDVPPGQRWQQLIQEQITRIESAAVFVGENGIGPWQDEEIGAFLQEFRQRECTVIPVLLPSAPSKPKLPPFLQNRRWVDFRKRQPDPNDPNPRNPLELLIFGIRRESPRRPRNSQ